ncbi:MAG: hypothetical protein V3T86_01650 [Planctomycetota bacterium]
MATVESLSQAHRGAVGLLDASRAFFRHVSRLRSGVPASDPRLREATLLRLKLKTALERAEGATRRDLVEFACVQAHPVRIGDDTGASAHEIVLEVAARLLDEPWSTDELTAYFRKYSLGEPGCMDWKAATADRDTTLHGVERFDCLRDDEFGPLLRIEHAKARKLLTTPGADVPLVLGNLESAVLEAIGDKVLRGKDVAEECGYAKSYMRDRLPRMVEKGLLEKTPDGYRRSPKINW